MLSLEESTFRVWGGVHGILIRYVLLLVVLWGGGLGRRGFL